MACRRLVFSAAVGRSSLLRGLLQQPQQRRRPFFASSTDHTRLLADAEVHRLPSSKGNNIQQYVMAAEGMEAAMIEKVPQLHLARLFVQSSHDGGSSPTVMLFGAKVINKTLGSPTDVCGKLVDAALADVAASAVTIEARGTLHGLSDWVLEGMRTIQQEEEGNADSEKHASLKILSTIPPDSDEYMAVDAIARSRQSGLVETAVYVKGRTAWEQLALEFVARGLSPDAALYESRGATTTAIVHQADDCSTYAGTSGAALAKLKF